MKSCFLGLTLSLLTFSSALSAPRVHPYRITCTVGMVADVLRNVAQDKATVKALLGAGVDPHLYKPTRDDVSALMRSDVVFYSGLMLEGKMNDVLRKLGRSKPVYPVAELAMRELGTTLTQETGHPDPHVWMDPAIWAKVTEVAGGILARYDPPNGRFYMNNAKAYAEQCLRLREYGKTVLSTIPQPARLLITSHDAFSYFGKAFALEVRGVQGISTESEAGLRRINALADTICQRDVPSVFVESSVPRKSLEALVQGVRARGKQLKIGGELFSDAMGSEGSYEGTYLGMIDHNITVVARALGGNAPQKGMLDRLKENGR